MASNESQEQDLEPTNPSAAEMNTPTQATGIGLDQLPLPSPTSSEELSLNDTTPLSLHTSEEIHSADLSSQEALESSINIFRAGSLSSSPALDIASPSANVGSAKYSIDTWEISIDTWERDTAYTGSRTVSRGSLWSEGSDRNIRTLEDELSGLNADEEASSPEISQWEDSDEAEDVVLGVTTTSDPFSDSKAVTSSSSDENDDPFADFDGVHREESGSEASTPAQASRSRLARLTIDDSSDDIADMLVGFPEPPQSASSDIFSARGDVEEDDEEGTEFFDRLSRDNSPQVETAKNHFEDLAQDQNSDADDEKEFSDSSPRSPPPRPQSRHGNYDREDDITPPHRARSWHGENEGGASPHSRPDNEHSSPDESDEERRRSWPGDYDESPSPPPRPSSRYDHRDDDNDSPPPRPTSRHSNHDDDNEDERPQTRYGSSDGFGGAPDFSSRFPTMSPYEVESPEGVVSPTEEEDINHAANQTTPERPAKKFDSYMGTGPSSPYSSSEYSPVSPDDESRMSAADRLAWQRQQFQRQVDMLRRMNGDGSNEDGPVYPPKRIAPPRPPRPAEGLDGYDFEFAKPIPRNLEDPEVELQRLRRRDSLDLNIWDSYGRPAEATADDPSGRAQVPSSIQVGEKTYETFTDFDQLSNNYIQENIQTQGQRQLAKLDAEIDDYFAQIDQAWELLLTKLEQRDGELSRGRSKGIGAAKRKILSDLDKDRRGFLSKASELDGKSSAWGKDGKITMTSKLLILPKRQA
ncbi:hypothetical protein EJ08DRAFT_311957 [Tothia fuscella]|uniref:Uncharacterized protein n=1 Tax=Tothia fuscella TaxID=1048955 RepID=A0A9P4NP94_9PEZI|nr:hypothetical protein EJ08DRAFT_311957 [Tothia fuscella]